MKVEEFAESYESRTDEDLLRLALHPEQLTPEATIALTNQLAKRRLGKPEQLKDFENQKNSVNVKMSWRKTRDCGLSGDRSRSFWQR